MNNNIRAEQARTLSQQLARLRADNLVTTRRESKQIYYRLSSEEAELVMGMVFDLFCLGEGELETKRPLKSTDAKAA